MRRGVGVVLLVLGACSPKSRAKVEAEPVVVGSVASTDAAVPSSKPRPFMTVLPPKCAPEDLCPIYPEFPQIAGFEPSPACIVGSDRVGCLTDNGWRFEPRTTSAPPPSSKRRGLFVKAPCGLDGYGWQAALDDGTSLFWSETGPRRVVESCRELPAVPFAKLDLTDRGRNGMVASAPNDVWAWSPHEIAHFDGATWTSRPVQATCAGSLNDEFGSSVVHDDAIWFTACDGSSSMTKRWLARVDRKTGIASRPLGIDEVEAIASPAPGELIVTAWREPPRERRRLRLSNGQITKEEALSDSPVRIAFDDGTLLTADTGFFGSVSRVDAQGSTTPLSNMKDAHALYAPTSHEIWAGGEELYRWDGKRQSTVVYRPDHAKAKVLAIGGTSATDLWVASELRGEDARGFRLSHFDGKSWTQNDVPSQLLDRGFALAAVSATEAWFLTTGNLWRWDGKSWTVANVFPSPHGFHLTVAGDSIYVSGDSTIYRRAR